MMKRAMCLAAALAVGLMSSGCWYLAAGAAAGGTYVYVKGELKQTLAAPLPEVVDATDEAAADLELKQITRKADGVMAHYELKTATDQNVSIHLESEGKNATRIGIRVGVVGDHDLSERILAAVKDNL